MNFGIIKVLFFLKDVDIEKALVSNKDFFSCKNYKYFLVTSMIIIKLQTKGRYFLIEDDGLLEK